MNTTLQTLFRTLHEDGISYFLLSDFESESQSGDIDLFVAPESKSEFEKRLRTLGWFKRKEPSYHTNHHFYYSPQSELYLDVKYSLTFADGEDQCYTYSNMDQALSAAVLNAKGVYRPNGVDAILLYAAHLAYRERGRLEPKHQVYLSQYISMYQAELTAQLSQMVAGLQRWLSQGFPHNTEQLKAMLRPYFSQQRRRMVYNSKFRRYGYGMKVLFLGTDGAGKSTLIEAVEQKLNLKTNKLYLGMGENGWTSPWVKLVYNKRLKPKVLDKAFSFLKSFVVLPAELLLRQLPVKLRSRYSIVLIDRVPGAFLMDKGMGKNLLYRSILPTPDLVFFLYASPEVLVARKPAENTLERSRIDINKFRKVAELVSAGQYIGIDTSHLSISEAADAIISEIYKSRKVYDNLLTAQFN
ncbi:nucleotidyltransferase family protein [Pontibacter lucknowensis]|uniref:Uncharacterized nucleotidyltransferase n=1 Tax=Pontibacter lucknowensis TaxID=1077936 RepID=A0A1N7AY99_9BACT|nr:nucleotidyltransferase family protein [Pontibacter lucknowensis]SIR44044.1 Uncharacterised nucleotidyltransferase [Pontibacter lucknowensis]